MADIDLKAATPDTTLPSTGFLVGADSQSASAPSVYSVQTVATALLGSTSLTGATVTTSSPVLDLAQTWNAGAVTFTGLKLNVTDTASASGSLLMDLQVGGTSRFNVGKAGQVFGVQSANNSTPTYSFIGRSTDGIANPNGQIYFIRGGTPEVKIGGGVTLSSASFVRWSNNLIDDANDLFLSRKGAANLRLGFVDAATAVPQTLGVQSVVAGTSNTAGANFTIAGSQGTGDQAGGSIVFQVAPAGTAGSAQNALTTALTIDSSVNTTFAGQIITTTGVGATSAIQSPGNLGIRSAGNASIIFYGLSTTTPTVSMSTSTGTLSLGSGGSFGFSSIASANGTPDTILTRDAANTLALRNGAAAQAFRVYNTFTDASNYERGVIAWIGNDLKIGIENAGTGVSTRQTHLYGGGQIRLYTASTLRWYVDASGHFLAGADNTYDIGATGAANRPRNLYVGTAIEAPYYSFNSRGGLVSNADGVFQLRNATNSNFDRLQFGGTTSSFPALKRSSTTLQARLADDSAFASVQGKLTTETAYTAGAPTATGYLVLYDSNGTAYKVAAEAL